MRKLVYFQVFLIFLLLANTLIYRLECPVNNDLGLLIFDSVLFVLSSALAVFMTMTTKRECVVGVGVTLIMFAALYYILTGVIFGFVMWVTFVVPIVPILVLLSALFAPSGIQIVTRAIARRRLLQERTRLVRERIRLIQALPALESKFRYREAPPDYSKLKNRLAEVNAQLTELNI